MAGTAASVFAEDAKTTPYWWEAAPLLDHAREPLPGRADVVVIGSGYTGLNAALQTVRGGRETLVLDAEDAGFGCSTRNGGQISTSIKPEYAELARRHGSEIAEAIVRTGQEALDWIGDFVAAEGIDCAFKTPGRFHAAHNAAAYEKLARSLAAPGPAGLDFEAQLVPRSEQRSELGSDAYFGGAVFPRHASLDPGRYHQGLLKKVIEAGASVVTSCPATAIEREPDGFSDHHAQRCRAYARGRSGHQWLHRPPHPLATAAADSDRQLRDRDRTSHAGPHRRAAAERSRRQRYPKGRLLLPGLAGSNPHHFWRPGQFSGRPIRAEAARSCMPR